MQKIRKWISHTILSILEAGQVLQSGTIQRSKRLAGDGSHGEREFSPRETSN